MSAATYDARVVDVRGNHLTVVMGHRTAAVATAAAHTAAQSYPDACRILVYEVTDGRHGVEKREVANVSVIGRG